LDRSQRSGLGDVSDKRNIEKTHINVALRSRDTPHGELKSMTLDRLKLETLIAALLVERKELEVAVSERRKAVTAAKKELKNIHDKKKIIDTPISADVENILMWKWLWVRNKKLRCISYFLTFSIQLYGKLINYDNIFTASRILCSSMSSTVEFLVKSPRFFKPAEAAGFFLII
jgi:hypothetical protein